MIGSAAAFFLGIALQMLAGLVLAHGSLASVVASIAALVLVLSSTSAILLAFLVSLFRNAGLEHCHH
ncbi:MAG: hypothetical protein B0D96_06745 [Candidatus Sedimenticola endophacoides]|uniref:Uncharacterized protein n=1 Tax=Candidatus Sedimenticola endophacoides TaxID=2548426 RepID=A0A657Q800_9GAMM|nr:MAG: hypothetical protein B0D84_02735 [Candidatus Sedimenticola endophacoides]OQX35479.1 MAG: hypothetical protein B0D96_06745 [Candidatus Sedimenticola endophacoides]OQX42547.1 MAG: hypothetical protein B0D82_00830 [Candidatus Sedimenticola endophacoides]OQX43240.1 MAG: hypothetical protein B0D88_04855 [Candidatus Sedimenticola endophacoides]OQX45682.1 MAG: hypothetical protein B0D86_03125 [Candidatus Sedimenticola endophacoides]